MFLASLQQVWTLTICIYMTQVLCAYTIPAMIFMIRWQESPVLALKCFFPLQLLSAGVEHFMGKAGPMVKLVMVHGKAHGLQSGRSSCEALGPGAFAMR